jgi:hypothetical protein
MRLETNYAMDAEFASSASQSPVLELNTTCLALKHPRESDTWSLEQCILRVRLNSECTKTCTRGIAIKAQLDRLRVNYKLTPFGKIDSEKTITSSYEKKLTKWGNRKSVERNFAFVKECLNGVSIGKLAVYYKLSKSTIRKRVYDYCRVANLAVYDKCPAGMVTLDYLRSKKQLFLPHFIV